MAIPASDHARIAGSLTDQINAIRSKLKQHIHTCPTCQRTPLTEIDLRKMIGCDAAAMLLGEYVTANVRFLEVTLADVVSPWRRPGFVSVGFTDLQRRASDRECDTAARSAGGRS